MSITAHCICTSRLSQNFLRSPQPSFRLRLFRSGALPSPPNPSARVQSSTPRTRRHLHFSRVVCAPLAPPSNPRSPAAHPRETPRVSSLSPPRRQAGESTATASVRFVFGSSLRTADNHQRAAFHVFHENIYFL